MPIQAELWQVLTIVGSVVAATVLVMLWIDGRFSKLLTIVQYDKKIDEIDDHIRSVEKALHKLELWAAKQNGPPIPRD